MTAKLSNRDKDMLALGIGLGLSVGAGVAGECDSGRQAGSMIESLSMQPDLLRTIANQAAADARDGIDQAKWVAFVRSLMREVMS